RRLSRAESESGQAKSTRFPVTCREPPRFRDSATPRPAGEGTADPGQATLAEPPAIAVDADRRLHPPRDSVPDRHAFRTQPDRTPASLGVFHPPGGVSIPDCG